MKKFVEAVATLIGCIIGAGVLGIPYVLSKAGFLTGVVSLIILGAALLILHLYVGEISLRTKGKHHLTRYAEKYLGKTGKYFMTAIMIFSIYGALTAYIIGEGAALRAIFGGQEIFWSLGFFVLFSSLVYLGLKTVEESEIILNIFLLSVLFLICLFSFSYIKIENLQVFDYSKLLIPYGVVFFAFIGTSAIPEMREILKKDGRALKKAIIIGSAIPIIAYLLFALVIVGVTGINTTEVATIGLGQLIGGKMLIFGNFFAVFAMAGSFLVLALALKWVFQYDYRINRNIAFLLTITFPLIIALSKIAGFIKVIGFTGAIAGSLEGILIVIMFHRAKKLGERKPEYSIKSHKLISFLLIVLFIGGILYQFI